MITSTLITASEWEAATGWHLEEKGWCEGDRCIPLHGLSRDAEGRFITSELAEATSRGMHVLDDVVAVGPEYGPGTGSVAGASLPELALTDRQGNPVTLASLVARRRRMVIHAWAPW
jgi:hypothetical protein